MLMSQKIFSKSTLAFLIICILSLGSFDFIGSVNAADFSGSITSDTTWTKADSPIGLTGAVTVVAGVKLTIEAGVTVNLNGYHLQVDGTLNAKGSSADKIEINDGNIVFSSASPAWDDQSSSGNIIQEAVLNRATLSNVNAIKIDSNSITAPEDASNGVLAVGGFSVISNNTIVSTSGKGYGIIVKQGLASITSNIISGFAVGIWAASEASIQKNTIINCGVGIGLGKVIGFSFDNIQFGEVSITVKENTIANNYIGLGGPFYMGKTPITNVVATGEATSEKNFVVNNTYGLVLGAFGSFRYNTISNSQTAITVYDTSEIYSPHLSSNNIINYSKYSLYLLGPTGMYAQDNWWGTTDTQTVSASIYDQLDNSVLGKVDFTPILDTADSRAPTQPSIPIPDLPTPLWSPSNLPNQQTSPTPTSSSNNSYFDLQSNSSITQLYFNSTSSELSFTVTGPEGTTGYVQYRIAKSLLSSVQNVKVYLDGSQLTVNITSTQDAWLLYFTYHHSSHTILIDLTATTTNSQGASLMWLGVPIAALVVAAIGVLVWKGRNGRKRLT
jgi:hypothetical protein